MTDKKEIVGYKLAVIAIVACCLLLTTVLVGGILVAVGSYLRSILLLILGIVIVAVAVSYFMATKRK